MRSLEPRDPRPHTDRRPARQPRRSRRHPLGALRAVAAVLLGVAVLTGCTSTPGDADPSAADSSSAPPSATPSAAEAAPRPPAAGCYALSFDQALAPTSSPDPVACAKPHTAQTYRVGELQTVVDGHLVAIDSEYVQQQPAQKCTPALRGYLGGSLEDLRLSMLRAVWFTPTVEESDAGAAWFRCDVIAVAGPDELALLEPDMRGVLGTDRGDAFAMCGTADPESADFTRVLCRNPKATWRAIAAVPLPSGDYPGQQAAREAGLQVCEDAGREAAADPLDFQWSYEWPTRKSWQAGQTYGICWAPA